VVVESDDVGLLFEYPTPTVCTDITLTLC
jgi:hypothetical protein